MNLFLDSSVVLAACASSRGASRLLFDAAPRQDWTLLTSNYSRLQVPGDLAIRRLILLESVRRRNANIFTPSAIMPGMRSKRLFSAWEINPMKDETHA